MDKRDIELDAELRAMSEPGPSSADARDRAQGRLNAAIADAAPRRARPRRFSRGGLAIAAALVAFPAGAAVGSQLADSGSTEVTVLGEDSADVGLSASDCPGVSQAFEALEIDPGIVTLGECPDEKQLQRMVDDMVFALERLRGFREQLEARSAARQQRRGADGE